MHVGAMSNNVYWSCIVTLSVTFTGFQNLYKNHTLNKVCKLLLLYEKHIDMFRLCSSWSAHNYVHGQWNWCSWCGHGQTNFHFIAPPSSSVCSTLGAQIVQTAIELVQPVHSNINLAVREFSTEACFD